MDGEESSLARLASWAGLVVLTGTLVGSVLLDRAKPPLYPSPIEESTRLRCLRALDHQITDALARGADDELRELQILRQDIDSLPRRQMGARP